MSRALIEVGEEVPTIRRQTPYSRREWPLSRALAIAVHLFIGNIIQLLLPDLKSQCARTGLCSLSEISGKRSPELGKRVHLFY